MDIKIYIKNDLWQINWIVPFTNKYLAMGKKTYIKKALPVILYMKVFRSGAGIEDAIYKLLANVELDILPQSTFFYWIDCYKTIAVKGNVLSNFSLDYNKIIMHGFNYIAEKAILADGEYGRRANIIKRAMELYYYRALEAIRNSDSNLERKNRMLKNMAGFLDSPVQHFEEGLQRILFLNQYLWQTRHRLNGIGHLDKILGDIYRKDIEDGVISRDIAKDLLVDFMKCLHEWYEYKSAALLGDVGQIIVLGGLEQSGEYFCNDLTYLCLEVQKECKQPDPKILLRVSRKMPKDLLGLAVECLLGKTGSPLFSNDDIVIPSLLNFGIQFEDAYNYCFAACWEPYIVGKSLDQNNIATFDFFDCFSKFLNQANLNEFFDYEMFLNEFMIYLKKEARYFAEKLDTFKWAKDIFVSMFTEGCNESAKDISEGGAIYNNYGVTSVGMGSVCDSLLHLKEIVYEKKEYSLYEINKMRNENYNQNPEVFSQLSNMKKYFGCDNNEGIALVNYILDNFNEELRKHINPFNGKIKYGLSAPNYIISGRKALADFSGRRKGEPYNTHISCTDISYSEIISFAGKLKYDGNGINGNVVDFFVLPNLVENHKLQFIDFMEIAIRCGYYQMQMNVIDSETLLNAKKYPEHYPGLIVRVWGFSAYFNDLPDEYKDLLIARAKKNESINY